MSDLPAPPKAPKLPKRPLPALDLALLEDETVIRGKCLSGPDLAERALRAVSFEGCLFQRVNLTGTRWDHLRLVDVQFDDCDLSGAKWPEAGLERVSFTDCRLTGFQNPEARYRHVHFTRVQAQLAL